MRIATGFMMFLALAANPACASEAFVSQVTHEVAATEATAASYLSAASASTHGGAAAAERSAVAGFVRAGNRQ